MNPATIATPALLVDAGRVEGLGPLAARSSSGSCSIRRSPRKDSRARCAPRERPTVVSTGVPGQAVMEARGPVDPRT